MSAADRVAEALLRLAVRRWPAELRDERAREWGAELHALRSEPGTRGMRRAAGQLRFAFSLAAASPVEDEDGVPRGRREGLPGAGRGLRPLLVLVLAGLLAAGPVSGIVQACGGWVLGVLGFHSGWPTSAAVTGLTSLPAVPIVAVAAWWLGRRMPIPWAGGRLGSAVVAPLALAVAFALLVVGRQAGTGGVAASLGAGALAWVLLTAGLAVAVVRLAVPGRRWLAAALAVIGTPLVVELATTAAALPATLGGGAGALTALAWAPLLLSGRAWSVEAGSWFATPDGISLLNATGTYPVHLLVLTGLALGYGLGAALPEPRWLSGPATTRPVTARPAPVRVLAAGALAAGVVAQLAGLLSWAYTLAILTPAMPLVGQAAPMPGGDGELYMWVAELRWGSITLAALGLLLAAADRRAAPLAAVVQTTVLLAADGMLARADATGAGGLRTALAAAAVAAAAAWWVAGARDAVDALSVRRRLAWVAVAACCGPILLEQGTAAVNHPYLPVGLAGVTAILVAMLAVVAACAAAAARPRRLTRPRLAALIAVPALLLGAWGAATGAGVPYELTVLGMLLTGPLALVVVGVVLARPPRRRWGPVVAATVLVLGGPVLGAVIAWAALMFSVFASNILFAVAGSSWQADGLSLLPGAVLVAVPAGILAAQGLVRPTEPPTPPQPTQLPALERA
ncbi:hypothetical protein GCM10022251_25600 [Phytohabitans flavus]|uniref:hypothetical protein n=1 Tax=Phytohabitans flavus TaxID=1076124 RepID=UPI001E504A36|nr:hypothetical protein [Phytohabitans flavus]